MKTLISVPFVRLLLVIGCLLAVQAAEARERGTNAFPDLFEKAATKRSDVNAYLLSYLNLAIYPEFLDLIVNPNLNAKTLHRDAKKFRQTYEKYTSHLFGDSTHRGALAPSYEFITSAPNANGYDAEAMVIGTPELVIVVFRGTDRVGSARTNAGYQWNEWLRSNFDFRKVPPGGALGGNVHEGFWNSLSLVKQQIAQAVINLGGKQKKVWITGHSLGSAHAQLFAAYLNREHGVDVQGVYAFAAPHVGDRQFVAELDGIMPGYRLQRFEFIDDPITMLPGYAMGFDRAGVRCYYDDLRTYQFDCPERIILAEATVLPALLGVTWSAIDDAANRGSPFHFNLSGSAFCYHHPLWYTVAAYKQLSKAQRQGVPSPCGLPAQSAEGCSTVAIARGKSNNPLDVAKDVVQQVVDGIAFNVDNLLRNASGDAIAEGTYEIQCLFGKKYLDRDGSNENGASINLSKLGERRGDNRFKIQRWGAIGYTIKQGSRFLEVDANDLFENDAKVQLWDANGLFGTHLPNQRWLFYKVGSGKYLLVNMASIKLLDADDNGITRQNGGVKQWTGIDGDPSQVWILHKK